MSDLVKTSVGLRVEGDEPLPWDVWLEFGEQLAMIEGAVQFWIGDWLNVGEAAYGEKYAQAVDPSQAKTWTNYAYVARSVDISRRRENVSFTKHALVAALEPADQEKFLDVATDVTTRELRAEITGQSPPSPSQTTCPNCGHTWTM